MTFPNLYNLSVKSFVGALSRSSSDRHGPTDLKRANALARSKRARGQHRDRVETDPLFFRFR